MSDTTTIRSRDEHGRFTSQARNQLAIPTAPYGPPYASDRAWQADGRDEWILDAMRSGLADALEASIKMDERDPEMRKPRGVQIIHFRSNRLPVDGDIADIVWALGDKEIEILARWRHDNSEQLNEYPRTVVDEFVKDADALMGYLR